MQVGGSYVEERSGEGGLLHLLRGIGILHESLVLAEWSSGPVGAAGYGELEGGSSPPPAPAMLLTLPPCARPAKQLKYFRRRYLRDTGRRGSVLIRPALAWASHCETQQGRTYGAEGVTRAGE